MSEQEISHIEIAEETEEAKKSAVKKNLFVQILADMEGWKKDAKKIGYVLLAILLVLILGWGIMRMVNAPSWGLRFHAPIERVKYQTHNDPAGKFSFVFPVRYTFDSDEQKKFGADYMAGFHLNADSRTGCDVRASEVGINFAKSDQEISEAIAKELSVNVKGLENFSGQRIKLNKRDAFAVNFSLIDPLGNKLRINQILISSPKQENYLLVCGSGEAQAEFFAQDFADFLRSFRLNS